MRKHLLLVGLILAFGYQGFAQQPFSFQSDTVCVRQPVYIHSTAPEGKTYYWGFCSGYLLNSPTGSNIGNAYALNFPEDVEIAKDDGKYYGFAINRATNEFLRYEFGSSLYNIPTVTNLGNLSNTMSESPSAFHLIKDPANERWYIFIVGGDNVGNSSLCRVDFGQRLSDTPNNVNYGNIDNMLNQPTGIFVSEEAGYYYGFVINAGSNELVRLTFGDTLAHTPVLTSHGVMGGIAGPSDMTGLKDQDGNWYLAVTNFASSTVSIFAIGNSLSNAPVGVNIGNPDNRLFNPTGISHIRDCDGDYFFITNGLSNDLVRLTINDMGLLDVSVNVYPNPAGMNSPTGISRFVRDHDDLFAFVVNAGDNSLSRVVFPQCASSSIPSSTDREPPVYVYWYPGVYNIYLALNEGLPDMEYYCDQITVLPIPGITITLDTTLCQGDTVQMFVQSPEAISYSWSPYYNISDTVGLTNYAWPEYTTDYRIIIPYTYGCIVDTFIRIDVIKVRADAGEDRLMKDGSSTILGGPMTSQGSEYSYYWTPNNFLDQHFNRTPVSTPLYDITYYLEVTTVQKGFTCKDIDTVVVRLECDDITLPNAFAPESNVAGVGTYGILNKRIIQLNTFQIYDRWGNLVFETTDPEEHWDGNYKGLKAPAGVYVWHVDAFCMEGKRIRKSGNVTLLR